MIEDGIENAKALSSLKDPKALAAEMPGTLAEPNLQKALSYSRSMYEAVSQTQAELTKLVEDYVGEVNKSVVSALDKAAKNRTSRCRCRCSGYRHEIYFRSQCR